MRKELAIKHEGKQLNVAVNVNVIRAYSKEYGLETIQDFHKHLVYTGKPEEIPFEMLDRYATFFLCAIREGARLKGEPCTLQLEDAFMVIEQNEAVLKQVLTLTFDGGNPMMPGAKPKAAPRKKKS